jgi:hypothetical protein
MRSRIRTLSGAATLAVVALVLVGLRPAPPGVARGGAAGVQQLAAARFTAAGTRDAVVTHQQTALAWRWPQHPIPCDIWPWNLYPGCSTPKPKPSFTPKPKPSCTPKPTPTVKPTPTPTVKPTPTPRPTFTTAPATPSPTATSTPAAALATPSPTATPLALPFIPEVPPSSPIITGSNSGSGGGQAPVSAALTLAGLITLLALVVFLSADRLIGPRRRPKGP